MTATFDEAKDYPQFDRRQVYSLSRMDRMQGIRPRKVWMTPHAMLQAVTAETEQIKLIAIAADTYPRGVRHWEPEPQTLVEQISALPASVATKSRDYGRGYSHAVRDVLLLLEAAQA